MSHYPVFGGPHNQAMQLAAVLRHKGWSTTVLLPDEPGNAALRLRERGIDVISLPLRRARASLSPRTQLAFLFSIFPDIARIRQTISGHEIDVVIVGGLINPHAAIAARMEGVPVVWQILDTRTPRLLQAVLVPVVNRLADQVMFCGKTLLDLHRKALKPSLPATVYFPPVDMDRFRRTPHRGRIVRRELGIPDHALVFGMVANVNPQKGIEFFIRAAALIFREVPDSWFVVVGSTYQTHSAYMDKLGQEILASGMPAGRVLFVGGRANVEDYYAAFDVKLITSVPYSEGVPTTAIEAMAAGLPIVATNVGALKELIENGRTGYLVPALDSHAIARASVRLAKDDQRRKTMGETARTTAAAEYSLEVCATTHVTALEGAIARHRLRDGWSSQLNGGQPMKSQSPLTGQAVCPLCHGQLLWLPDRSRCNCCGQSFPIVQGIPCFVTDLDSTAHDEANHHCERRSKRGQRDFFDSKVAEEFETTRPHDAPRLYKWLLSVKLGRALNGLASVLPGRLTLTVCGGSGMDAEFLARLGARVIASDLSLGAALRTAERARRYGLDITPIVADVERLPFPDRSIDLVLVHDGLHHLPDPQLGLSEISRVAAKAVSITEPARAGATAVAIQLKIARQFEEAGNRVERFRISDLTQPLSRHGFEIVAAKRYAMYYRHKPGPISAALSRQPLLVITQAVFYGLNIVLGRFGNKVAVQARRGDSG